MTGTTGAVLETEYAGDAKNAINACPRPSVDSPAIQRDKLARGRDFLDDVQGKHEIIKSLDEQYSRKGSKVDKQELDLPSEQSKLRQHRTRKV